MIKEWEEDLNRYFSKRKVTSRLVKNYFSITYYKANASETTMSYHFTHTGISLHPKKKNKTKHKLIRKTRLGTMWRKWNPHSLLVALQTVCSHCGDQHGDSSKKLIMELPYDPQPGDEGQCPTYYKSH